MPAYNRHTIAGETFEMNDGIFGMAISPQWTQWDNDRYLFFHSLASVDENAVSLNTINWEASPIAPGGIFQTIGQRGIQTAGK